MAKGVTIDIAARISGYEQSLAQLRAAIQKLDPGSALARSLNKGLAAAESQVKSLGKNLNPKFTSDAQLDKFIDKFNGVGDVIENIRAKMQDITSTDLNFDTANESIKGLVQQLNELQNELTGNINKGFKDAINNSEELTDAFSKLNIDVKDKNPGEVFEALAKKAEESKVRVEVAARDLNKAQENLTRKQNALSKAENSPINNKEALQNELQELTASYTEAMETIKADVTAGLTNMLGANNPQLDKIATAFLGGLTPDNLKDRLKELKDKLQTELGKGISAKEIYSKLFGDMGKGGNAQAVSATIISKLFPNLNEIKEQFSQKLQEISTSLTTNQVKNINELISEQDIEAALNETLKDIDTAYKKLQGELIQKRQEVAEALAEVDTAKQQEKSVTAESTQITNLQTDLLNRIKALENENQVLKDKINEITQTITNQKESNTKEVKDLANKAAETASQWKITADAANQYSDALEKVQQREQLVGKIEGVVQRWFSIYAAVRMVGNAIRSVISTIKELDKTITDITIVTNMSREDLWGQMPQYTQMAQDYAVSISGVYQVSQLFYQQGLQTNDVLTLTGETLKMARIAGLDYAEATNYMTNALRSFKLEMDEASRVTNVYSVLAANAAVSVSEIAEAMSKTASSAYAVGSSLENTATMITVMTEATRESASNIGSALKSIISRYGEMTSNPKQLIDSEGEEMSLNKVDRALQSVGITLQDTQGQFRNFDDVIMELASVWDTLDNNTQRYIATVMAGNRQQSRFLALVSSYERYAELSEKAANAAGAGQEQFEKTLEGIEARTQQLQTSLQNLYTSAGLEQLYGGLLGIADNILQYYNSISDAFGNGIQGAIAAVATFGAQFYNIANIVINVLKLIKANYTQTAKEIEILTELEAKKRAQIDLSEDEKKLYTMLANHRKFEADKTKESLQQSEIRATGEIKAFQKIKQAWNTIKNNKANIAYGIGTIGSIIGSTVGGETGNIISGTSGLIGAAGAFATGNYVGGILSLVTSFTSFASAIDTTSKALNEYNTKLEAAKEAQKRYIEAQKKATDSKNIVTDLNSEIKKLDELTAHRYDSVESQEAYQNQIQEIAKSYPELITYYDKEGKALDINIDKLKEYAENQEKIANQAIREAAIKRLQVDETLLEIDAMGTPSNVKGVAAGEITDVTNAFKIANSHIDETIDSIDELRAAIRSGAESLTGFTDHLSEQEIAQWYGISVSTDNDIRSALSAASLPYKSGASILDYIETPFAADEIENRNAFYDVWNNFWTYIKTNYSNQDFAEIDFTEAYDKYMEQFGQLTYDSQTSYMRATLVAAQKVLASKSSTSRFQSLTEQAIQDYVKTGGYESTLETIFVQNYLQKGLSENVLKGATITSENWQDYAKQVEEYLADEKNYPNLSKLFYGTASSEDRQKINEKILPEITKFSWPNLTSILSSMGVYEDTEAYVAIEEYWNTQAEYYLKLYDEYKTAANEELKKLLKDDYRENFSPEFLGTFTTGLSNIVDNKDNLKDQYDDALIAYSQLWDTLNELSTIAPETFATIQQLILTKGINSISGIFAIIDALPDFEGKDNLSGELQHLADYIVPKFGIEFDSMTDTLITNFEGLTKAISNAQNGMNLSEATQMADGLNKKITDFSRIGTKYYFTDYMALADSYLESQEELAQYLFGRFDIEKVKPEDQERELEAFERANAARDLYYQAAREAYLAEGRIADFLESFNGYQDIDEDEITIRAMLAAGEIPEDLQAYATQLIEWYNSLGDDVYKVFMDSLSNGEMASIKVTDSNKDILSNEVFQDLIQGEIVLGETIVVNFAKATNAQLHNVYEYFANNQEISNKERESYLNTIDSELKSRNTQNIYKEVFNSYESFDRTMAEKFAKAVGNDLSAMNLTFDEVDRTFSMSIEQMKQYADELRSKGASPEVIAELTDIIQDAYKNVGDLITKGLEGTLSNAEGQQLVEAVKREFGIDISLQKLNSGLGISRDLAIQLYSYLNKVSGVAGEIAFEKLKENLTSSGQICENIHKTLAAIKETHDKINKGLDDENHTLENQLQLYNKIANSQLFDPKTYDFMNRSLPSGMQGPLTYFNNMADMYQTISDAMKNKYIDPTDYYNMLMEYHDLAKQTHKTFTIFGQEVTEDMSTVLAAWQQGTKAMQNQGGSVKFGLEGFGLDFAKGVDGAKTNIDSGISEFADSQIKMLDSLINFFDALAALESFEDTNKALLGDNGILEVEDVFEKDTTTLKTTATDWINTLYSLSDQQQAALNEFAKVEYKGQLVGIVDLMHKLPESTEDVDEFISAWSKLFAALNNTEWNPDGDLSEQINQYFGGGEELPKYELELGLKMTKDGGEIADAEAFAALVQQFIALDDTGNITIKGENGTSAFSLDIQNGTDATGTVVWDSNHKDDYTGTPDGFYDWLKQKAQEYAETVGLVKLDDFALTTSSLKIDNGNQPASIDVSIKYTSVDGTSGDIIVGTVGRRFGPKEHYKTAGEALQAAAEEYNLIAGSGTLHDISFPIKTVKVTSANNVDYDFILEPGTVDTTSIDTNWGIVESNITDFISALDSPEFENDNFTINTDTNPWTVDFTSSTIGGKKEINYQFKLKNVNFYRNKAEIRKQLLGVKSNINDLTELANTMPEGTIINATGNDTNNYSVEIETTDITGKKTIHYNFDIEKENLGKNSRTLQEKWASVKANIDTLREQASKFPYSIEGVTVSENGEECTVEFNGVDIGGDCKVNYNMTLTPTNTGLTAQDFASACTTVAENITTYKDSYKELMDAAGLTKLGIFQSKDGSLHLEANIHAGDGVSITWTSVEFKGDDFETVKKSIEDAKADLIAWKAQIETLNSTKDEALKTTPEPIEVDTSIHLVIKDDGVYFDNGPLAGNFKYSSIAEAMAALSTYSSRTSADVNDEALVEHETTARNKIKAFNKTEAKKWHEGQVKLSKYSDVAQVDTEEEDEIARQQIAAYQQAQADIKQLNDLVENDVNLAKVIDQYFKHVVDDTVKSGADVFKNAAELKQDIFDEMGIEISDEAASLLFNLIMKPLEEFSYDYYDTDNSEFKKILNEKRLSIIKSLIPDTAGEVYKTGSKGPSNVTVPKIGGMEDREGLNNTLTDLSNTLDLYAQAWQNKFGSSGGTGNQGKGNKDPQTQLLITTQQMAEVTETNAASTETISTTMPLITAALDGVNTVAQNILSTIPDSSKQFSLAELAATELKATVHGDFWGEGNQIVLSDGNGGNIHADLRDYITQFNQVFADIAAIGAENSPIIIDIEANTTPFISKLNDAISNANRRTATVKVGSIFSGLLSSVLGGGEAKGNVALAKGTLMGELGPELYVTGGHYYIAGRNGAEFINLPDDAIVFNHLQTKRLLGTGSSGRGTAVTNEKKATAHATGNVAMASASETADALRAIKAMWQDIKNMNLKDFASKAGAGGGGGGKNGLDKGYIADLERWYNLLRQIDKLEKDINYEEKLRSKLQSDRVANGAAIYESQKRSLESIEKEIAAHRELATLQESYYDARVKAFQESEYSRIFKFTDQGLMQYNDEDIANDSDLVGLFALAQLNATDINNQPLYTAKEQYQKLVDMGFGNELKYTAEGEAVDLSEDDGYSKAVEAFWDKLEGWKDELDDLYDSYNEQLDAILDNEVERNKLMQEIVDNQRAVEDKVLEAIENREQAIIDELQKERDAISEAADNYIDGLNQQLSKERDMYQRQESAEGLRKLRRQLAILERSGGSASQIANLREQIASGEQDQYFEAQQQQIDAVKEASDLEIERLDHQIEIMTETLAYQKENGLLWGEVAEIMAKNPADIVDFITKYSPDWAAASSLGKSEELREIQLSVEAWTAYYKDLQQKKDVVDKGGSEFDWNTYAKEAAKNYSPIWEENKDTAKSLFEAEFAKSGDPNAAWNAVYKYLNPLMAQYKKEHPEEFKQEVSTTETTTSTTSATADNQKRYYYTDENGQTRYTTNKAYYDQRMAEINGAKGVSYVGADTSPVAKEKTTAKKYGYSYNVGGMYDKSDKVYNSEAEAIQAAIAAIKALNLTSEKKKQALNSVKAYDQGGLANYTGLAMLHGSKDKPEAILNAEQTAILRNDILGNSSNSLLSLLQDFRKSIAGVSNTAALSAANSIIIENANVNMNIDSIANDYDAQRAGEQALDKMLEIARKTGVQSLRR